MTFSSIATYCAKACGKPAAFVLSVAAVVVWAATGPLFHYSDTWQLVINTSTTIISFLVLFLIQHSQNRDGLAIQAKLDELILATDGARNELAKVETLSEAEIEAKRS